MEGRGTGAQLITSLSPTWGTDLARAHFGVTFAKKGLFWAVEGRGSAQVCRADLPQPPKPTPNPSSHRLAKPGGAAGGVPAV